MKAYKRKRIRNVNNSVSDENEIRSFIIILAVILVVIGLVYGITELVNKKKAADTVTETEINYDVLSVGTIFTPDYDDYYVLIYDSKDNQANVYGGLFDNYKNGMASTNKKIYYIDLNNKLNSKYYNVNNDGKSNSKATKISEFNFGKLTLLEIKNKKIVSYVEDFEKILKLLS